MEENKKEIYKLILLGVSIVLLIIFVIINKNINSNNKSNIVQGNTYSNKNDIDADNLKKVPGYNNLYYHELELEIY